MAQIKMLMAKHGSPDGHSVRFYEKGEVYEVSDTLARIFVEQEQVAEYADAPVGKSEVKAEKAPKNKAEKPLENKGA